MDRAERYRQQLQKNERAAQQRRLERQKQQAAAAAETARQVEALRRQRGTLPPVMDDAQFVDELSPFLRELIAQQRRPVIGECGCCGERMYEGDEAGEFARGSESVLAHAQCGIDAGLELA